MERETMIVDDAVKESGITCDVAVIGGGTGGYSAALRAAQLGLNVVLVDSGDRLGGTCLNRGCVPTKALLTAARIADGARRADDWGITLPRPDVNGAALHSAVASVVDGAVSGLESLVAARGIIPVKGAVDACARDAETGMWSLHISPSLPDAPVGGGCNGDDSHSSDVPASAPLLARDVVIATGSHPRALDGIPFAGPVLDSTGALALNEIPRNAVIIGSGAVALEFASLWTGLGAQVTVLMRHDRPLTGWDRRIGAAVMRGLSQRGVRFVKNMQVEGVQVVHNQTPSTDDGFIQNAVQNTPVQSTVQSAFIQSTVPNAAVLNAFIQKAVQNDAAVRVEYAARGARGAREAQVCLVAVGREPNADEPFITHLGIADRNSPAIPVDGYGRTRAEGVWAVGDVTPGARLAHRAFDQGTRAAESIAALRRAGAAWDDEGTLRAAGIAPYDDALIPRVVFSFPQAASVGLSEDEAKARGYVDVARTDTPVMGLARYAMGGDPGAAVVISGRRDDETEPRILGISLAGPEASEDIAEAQQLIRARVPLREAAGAFHPHPTFGEALGEALLRADGRPLHTV